jgi:hypothetical protein
MISLIVLSYDSSTLNQLHYFIFIIYFNSEFMLDVEIGLQIEFRTNPFDNL